MRKIIILLFVSVFFMVSSNFDYEERKKIILIDPGHGGFDGGAVSKRKTIEKEMNLKIALKLKDKLIEKYDVVMTREEDVALHDEGTIKHKKLQDLNKRRKMIDETHCDLFISIHLNQFNSPNVKGCQAYYADNENSKIFAEILNENFGSITGGKKRAPKVNEKFIILKDIKEVPSVIFEGGFLSNAEEDKMLNTDEYQTKLAEVIEKSIDDYFDRPKIIENNTTLEQNDINSTIDINEN